MKESDLYQPVRAWLERQGWVIHVEMFDHDIVASRDGRWIVVELKKCMTWKLTQQCDRAARWADEVWCAIASDPKTVGDCRQNGFGVLIVRDGKVRKKLGARPQPWHWHKRRKYRVGILSRRAPAMPHELAGLPSSRILKDQRRRREAGVLTEENHG